MTFGALNQAIVGHHTRAEWEALVKVWGWHCFYCGNPVRERKPGEDLLPENQLTKDHLVPLCVGGVDFISNIVPACLRCNRLKGARTSEEFLRQRHFIAEHVKNHPPQSTGVSLFKPGTVPACVVHFAEKKEMPSSPSPQERRELLRRQADDIARVLGRKRIEAAGQMRLDIKGVA